MFAKHFYGSARDQFAHTPLARLLLISCVFFITLKNKLTFDLPVARLAFAIVTDDPGILAMATVVRAGGFFDAVS